MPTFSRWMPKRHRASAAYRWSVIIVLGVGMAWLLIRHPLVVAVLVALFVLGMILDRGRRKGHAAIALSRRAESLCTFARAFPRDERDAWVLRGVYEEIGRYVSFSVHPEDRFREDLAIDDDDLDELAVDVARRIRREIDAAKANPNYGRVKTVGDLVRFVSLLPPTVAA